MGALDCVSNDRIKSTESTEVFTINMTASNQRLDEPTRNLESYLESQSKSCCSLNKHRLVWTLAVDVPLLVIVFVLIGLFELRVLPGHKGGFFCNDPKLSYPFTGDTVSMTVITVSVILLPVPFFLITELLFVQSEYIQRTKLMQAIRNSLWLYRSYAYGLFINLALVEVMKGVTGAPRPTFFDICQPDKAFTCQGSEYVSTFECTPSLRFSSWFQTDSYHSFPSGHTSLSVYCGLFVAWYLQRRAFNWTHRCVLVVPILQLSLLAFSAVCSLTRVTDHRHHWWDVLAGTAIGVASVLYSVLVLSRNFLYAEKFSDVKEIEEPNLHHEHNRQNMIY